MAEIPLRFRRVLKFIVDRGINGLSGKELEFGAVDFGVTTAFHGLVFLKNKAKRDFVGAARAGIA
jgi:hypothetical protein